MLFKKSRSGEGEEASTGLRALALIVEAIAVHAVHCEGPDREKFQSSVRDIRQAIEDSGDGPHTLTLAGDLIRLLEVYHRSAESTFSAHVRELRSVIAMLTQSLLQLSTGSQESSETLRDIQKQIESASLIENIRGLRGKLAESLKAICDEASQQQKRSQEILRQVTQVNSSPLLSEPLPYSVSEIDSVTGLPGPGCGERALRTLVDSNRCGYSVGLRLERMEVINSRFGFAAGDQVMLLFGQHLGQNISGQDQLFRWNGPCFMAIVNRESSVETVRHEIARVASGRWDYTIEVGSRTLLLPVSARWTVLPLQFTSLEDIVRKLNQFSCGAAG